MASRRCRGRIGRASVWLLHGNRGIDRGHYRGRKAARHRRPRNGNSRLPAPYGEIRQSGWKRLGIEVWKNDRRLEVYVLSDKGQLGIKTGAALARKSFVRTVAAQNTGINIILQVRPKDRLFDIASYVCVEDRYRYLHAAVHISIH